MVESFLRYLQFEKRVSPHTLQAYQNDLSQFQDFIDQTFPGDSIQFADYGIIRAWIIHLVELSLEAPSVNRKIACLRTFYKFLLKQEVIEKDPMLKIKVLKTKKKLPDFIREGEIMQMLDNGVFDDNGEGLRDKLILELFYATGMRLSELIKLIETQVDTRNCVIKVLGKRNKERVIPFPSSLVSIIEQYRNYKKRELGSLNHQNFFVTDKGQPCYPMMVYRIVRKHLQENTTSNRKSPHILRHTYATHLLNKGAEINAVKDLLGHSSLAATQVYTHNSMEKLKKVFEKAHPKA